MPTTRGTLTVTSRNDTLEARVDWIPGVDGRTSPAQTLRGRANGDSAVFVTETDGSVASGANAVSVRPVISWRFARREGALVGVLVVEIPGGAVPIAAMPVHAVPYVPPTPLTLPPR